MKNLICIISVIVFCMFGTVTSATDGDVSVISEVTTTCEQLKESGADGETLARSGCCSWHDGVCGCSGGRQVCCDGSFSPSCTCNKEEPPEVTN